MNASDRWQSWPGSYLRSLFRPKDTVAILAVPRRGGGGVQQRFPSAGRAQSPSFQAWLRHLNAQGFDIYLGVNPIDPTRGKREKQDVNQVRRLQLDLDDDGPAALERLMRDVKRDRIPQPAHVLSSSKDRYQVLWNTNPEAWSADQAEDTMRRIAAKYGGDPAATDISRVMRVPGFRNKKEAREGALCTWKRQPKSRAVLPGDFQHLPRTRDLGGPPLPRRERHGRPAGS